MPFDAAQQAARQYALTKVDKIIDQLADYVGGEVELTASQVTAAKTLLNKVLPDLSSHKHSGDEESPMQMVETIERIIVHPDKER